MSQLRTHPDHPEVQFTKEEADFLVWFFGSATEAENSGDAFLRKATQRIPEIEAGFIQRIKTLLDIYLPSHEERV